MKMFRAGLAGVCVAVLVGGAHGASPDPKTLVVPPAELSRARELVEKLGNDDFAVREDAQTRLLQMGRLALSALSEGVATHPSPEVRFRCNWLLPRAEEADLQARIDTFLADTEGKFDHDLPGWAPFSEFAGSTLTARRVFVDLLSNSTNRSLMLGSAHAGADLAQLVAARKQEIYLWRFPRPPSTNRREPALADMIALMFSESRVPSRLSVPTISVVSALNTNALSEAIHGTGEKARVYKAVVVRWVETRDEPVAMYQAITFATNLRLREASAMAARLVALKTAPTFYRAQAAMSLSRLEATEQIPALEATFEDETMVIVVRRPNAAQEEIQMRDVGLAAALLLAGQTPEDYGFTQQYKSSGEGIRYHYSNWVIAAEKRPAALSKWKTWRGEHPDFGKRKAGK